MVATVIALIATFSILSLSSNTKYLFNLITKHNDFSLKASILAKEKNNTNLYENLLYFKIDNDDIIKALKKEKLNIKTTEDVTEIPELKLTQTIQKIKIYDKTNSLYVYEVNFK
jgi:hypothetical protein